MRVTLRVNGGRHELEIAPDRRLIDVLRDDLGLLGTKLACGEGACGACAVLLDGRSVASCILLAAAAEGREIRTIEALSHGGPSPLQAAFVAEDALQCGFCTPGQIVSATALLERVAAADDGRDPRGDGGQPLPLRRLPEDRARDPARRGGAGLMARLVRSTREMEGRVEEVWALVDEDDDLETWPADADLAVVGSEAPRLDGAARAAGRVEYTVDVRLPGMLHAAVLRSPHAHARVASLDVEAALEAPGVRAVLTPESTVTFADASPLVAEALYAGQPLAAVAADTPEHAEAGLAALAAELEPLPHVVDPDEALREQRFTRDPVRARPRRRGRRARSSRRHRRARARDARPRADGARAARRGRGVERRRPDGLGLDARDVRRPEGASDRASVSAASRCG